MTDKLQSDGPFEAVIGLEVHAQLKTESKMFCGSPNKQADEPNVHVCPICMGHPGVMPQINQQAVELGVRTALAVGSRVLPESQFDRKHYFYPDLPKGFQTTQYITHPLAEGGAVRIFDDGGTAREIRFDRMHLEDDAAKLSHDDAGRTLVDYNRAGTPLIEMVSQPDMRTPEEAKKFLQELQLILRYIGASDADMDKGQMRCDANISLRPAGDSTLYARTEIKNLNSFRSVERAILYEIKRQEELWNEGEVSTTHETRGWNDAKNETFIQREKEEASDYRYFPEPDLPPMQFSAEYLEEAQRSLPELPQARRFRFMKEFELSHYDASVLTANPEVSEYYEQVMSELQAWIYATNDSSEEDAVVWESIREKMARKTVAWLTTNLFGLMNESGMKMEDVNITGENFAELMKLIWENRLNSSAAQKVLTQMLKTGDDPSNIMEDGGFEQVSDEGEIDVIVEKVINGNESTVGHYKSGKQQAIMYLVGQVMKEMKGKANPQVVLDLLKKKLD